MLRSRLAVLGIALVLSAFLSLTEAKVSQGSLYASDTQFLFVDKFCFDGDGGEVNFWFKADHEVPGQKVAFFHDVEDNFPALYESGNSCEFKKEQAAAVDNIDLLWNDFGEAGKTYSVYGSRPRWWYVVLLNCENEEIAIESFEITFTNEGGTFRKHFGWDEEGIFEASIFYFICFFLLSIASCGAYRKSVAESDLNRPKILRIISGALMFETFVFFLKMIERSQYSKDGMEDQTFESAILLFSMMPEITLTFIILAMSHGWMVSSQTLVNARNLVETMVIYTVALFVLFWWSFQEESVVDNDTIYDSASGAMLIGVQVILTLSFWSNVYTSWYRENDPKRQRFLVLFAICGSLWFLALPLVGVISSTSQNNNRTKVVQICQWTFDFMIYAGILGLFRTPNNSLLSSDKDRLREDQIDVELPHHQHKKIRASNLNLGMGMARSEHSESFNSDHSDNE